MGDVRISRIYDREPAAGGVFFVERLWPRGVRREELPAGAWLKDVAPSPDLRRWYAHDVGRWEEFGRRYRAELEANAAAVQPLLDAARAGGVTLLYSARDTDHNSAVVLREYLLDHLQAR